MKLAGMITLILMVGMVMFCWGGLVDDFETNYVDTNISEAPAVNSSFKSTYNRQDEINETFASLESDLNTIGSDASWYDRLGSGFNIIFTGFITLPAKIITVIGYGIADTTTILSDVGIPKIIIGAVVLIIFIVILFKLVEAVRKYPI